MLQFQAKSGLEETGAVDGPMWNALGTLITAAEPVPDPEVVNAEPFEKKPPAPRAGPPIVTCKAWAIADGQSGELLWGHQENKARPPASMTKVMTAYLVARLAASSAEVLDEVVTFSRRADDTIGSSAGVRAGESLPVRELLFGLLLPSGNDASVALAEHFGHRLRPGGNGSNPAVSDPYEDFVAAMNRAAGELGMDHSHFHNTHGLTEAGHECSPRDMLKLAHAAMQMPLIQRSVRTPVHGCQLEGPGGYRRNLRWKNTNRLLGIEGYDGIKTGTTSAAGSCLASRYPRRPRGAGSRHGIRIVGLQVCRQSESLPLGLAATGKIEPLRRSVNHESVASMVACDPSQNGTLPVCLHMQR